MPSAHSTSGEPQTLSPHREQALFLEGIRLFNQQEFFEAHEVWEEIWRPARGVKRDFYQGLIQSAVALEHCRRSNPVGALRLWQRLRKRLASVPPTFLGMNLRRFLGQMHDALEPVTSAPSPTSLHERRAPRIELDRE